MQLLHFTDSGIFCPLAGVYIDPWKPVERAIVTHAHSDHAKYGSRHYLSHSDSEAALRLRLGQELSLQTVEYGEVLSMNGVHISLHPAGHILGSAQVRIEYKGEVWVVSGDYKLQDDHFSAPFEAIKCNTFITESTFGLPVYKWQRQEAVMDEIKSWWQQCALEGKTAVLMGYVLGKMQRLLVNLQPFISSVYAHGAVYNMNEALRKAGYHLPQITHVSSVTDKKSFKGALVLAPSSALNSSWLRRFGTNSTAWCSGWMAIRGAKNRYATDRGFVLSDHADWNELNFVIKETQAEQVLVTHGYTDVFAHWLNENGIRASVVNTKFGDEQVEKEAEIKGEE